jgi:nucleoside-diphosphate-sugar epimerase
MVFSCRCSRGTEIVESTHHLLHVLSASRQMGRIHIALVGGSGFVGHNLSVALAEKGYNVLVIDNNDCNIGESSSVTFRRANITDEVAMRSALAEFVPAVVIHLASMGMSGSAMLSPMCRTVNVHGTSKLIGICVELNIPNFLYTSSYNVVYGGKQIINGDESLPYFPLDQHTDQYGPTKAMAEQLVLKANGRRLKGAGYFRAACIRPAAIYGEDEQRHLPRIVKHIDTGLFQFRIGSATVDWVDVSNLVSETLPRYSAALYVLYL